MTKVALIALAAALCGCIWLQAQNASLADRLLAANTALAVCSTDALNAKQHKDRADVFNNIPDGDLVGAARPSWMR